MTAKIFIDGEVGTTGLQIRARLEGRPELELISLDSDRRKDAAARREAINAADLVILCLPDEASKEAVTFLDNPRTRMIDASTAHRTAEGWTYGFPEWRRDQAQRIAEARFVSNPGCYALTSVAMLTPLVEAGLLPADWPVSINAISGYSGGGKSLIAAFEDPQDAAYTETPFRVYGLSLAHKHVPEIQHWSGLSTPPLFVPSVGNYYKGMIVQVPLALNAIPGRPSVDAVYEALAERYQGCRFVRVLGPDQTASITKLEPEELNGSNDLMIHVFANAARGHVMLAGVLDNLGKGASGQAVQNLNLMLGLPEEAGLDKVIDR